MTMICSECVLEPTLKTLIESLGSSQDNPCLVCGVGDTKFLDPECPELKNLFRALIRYHYSEWTYNSHWGGDHLEQIFLQENPITDITKTKNHGNLCDAVNVLYDPVYEDYDKGISLHAGYTDGEQNRLLEALKQIFDPGLVLLDYELKERNHFELEDRAISIMEPHVKSLKSLVKSEAQFCRARIGVEAMAAPNAGWWEHYHYEAYSGSAISAPPPHKATSGRMNRSGVSFLYLTLDAETAIAEIRPHPGHFVSIGKFTNKSELVIADLNQVKLVDYCRSDVELDGFLTLKSIDKLFSLPVAPDDRDKFTFTQFLCEVFRKLGFDGISYRSSLTPSANFVFFNPKQFDYVEGTEAVVSIKEVLFKHEEMPLIEDPEDYWTDPDGSYPQKNHLLQITAE